MAISGKYVVVQIFPTRVHTVNQFIFPRPIPAFDLLFPFNGCPNIGCCLIIHQFVNVISGSKAVWIEVVFVFINTLGQIVCYAGIDCGVGDIGENVYIVRHMTASWFTDSSTPLRSAQNDTIFDAFPFLVVILSEGRKPVVEGSVFFGVRILRLASLAQNDTIFR